jgi:hypothetical protein
MILIVTDPATGGTFLNWCLHYLAGHKTYYRAELQSWEDLVENPVTGINAHHFKPNQPGNPDAFDFVIKNLQNEPTTDFHTMYMHNFSVVGQEDQSFTEQTSNCIQQALSLADKVVVLTNNQKHNLYKSTVSQRVLSSKFSDPSTINQSFNDQHNDFVEYFFKQSREIWNNNGQLTDVWDQREFLALNIRPFKTITVAPNVDLTQNHYAIDTFDLYNTFDQSILDLLNYLEITLDCTRETNWKQVYQQWKKIHYNRMIFVWYFDTIINYIINGYDMSLTRFNLDIVQEAAIQNYLLYNHNLNLKTWQLEKFINTKQLHQLLTPNEHTLTEYQI